MRRIVLLVVIAGVGYSAWLHHRATQRVAALITELRPHVLLRYESLSALPWQALTLNGITLEPVGSWREGLNLPVGYRLNAAELQWRGPEAVTGHSAVTLVGLRVPVAGWPTTMATPLQRAAINHIDGNLQLEITPPLSEGPWQLSALWQTDLDVSVSGRISVNVGPEFPALSPSETLLVNAQLAIDDRGLLSRLQQSEALAARRSVGAWADRVLGDLERRAEQREWPLPDSALATMESLLQQPRSFTVTLSPPVPTRLDQLNLYAPNDRWTLLGLTLNGP